MVTEDEWYGDIDFDVYLETCMWLREEKKNHRKLRLWSCACCRRLEALLPDMRSMNAINVAERVADGLADKNEIWEAKKNLRRWFRKSGENWGGAAEWAASAAHILLFNLEESAQTAPIRACKAMEESGATTKDAEYQMQFELLRDIFGNPFSPVSFQPEWRTTRVASLAKAMYDSRDFSAMLALADALQEAGCEDEDILKHCRSSSLHVKGCWVVDFILDKH